MERHDHAIISGFAFGVLVATGLLSFFTFDKSATLLFAIAFTVFSTWLNPDIDQKIPFLAHRGATHNHWGIVIVSAGIAFLVWLAHSQFHVANLNMIIPLVFGASFAWFVHQLTDVAYDKIRNFTWVLVALVLIATLKFVGGI